MAQAEQGGPRADQAKFKYRYFLSQLRAETTSHFFYFFSI